ncbi:eCIS core domain-containing protein [Nostoc sp.]|uniref:eCIS core domain-containing protein n=1 Tax=Nostoc sp. TaxID=1180 RepID=UPI002FF5FA6C
MSKQSGKVQAKSWQPPAVQTASFGFSARPFPEIARKEEGKEASLDLLQMKSNQPGGMIDNINRSLASASPPAPLPILGQLGVQAKLTLGTVSDVYEQEADRVARQVVDEIHSDPFRASNTTSEGESIAKGQEAGRVQRQITVRAAGDAGGEISSEWEGELVRAKGGGQPMSPTVREPMERAFGADFGGVRVHTGAQADMLARSIQAKAFTTGQDVFFRQGAYEPQSRGGQELIAHELTHVQQQRYGVNDDIRRVPEEYQTREHPKYAKINKETLFASFNRE